MFFKMTNKIADEIQEVKIGTNYIIGELKCDVCDKQNTEFIEYSLGDNKIVIVCQSCISRQFRQFSSKIKALKNK